MKKKRYMDYMEKGADYNTVYFGLIVVCILLIAKIIQVIFIY